MAAQSDHSQKSQKVVCPNCHAVNRVPNAKLSGTHDTAKCGKCKTPLFSDKPLDLTDASFAKFVSKTSLPIVVDFWAPWCGPCKTMGPEFTKAAIELEPRVRFAKLDTQANPDTATQYRISGIPNMILFKGGKVIAQQAGAMRAQQIQEWIEWNI